MNSVITIPPGVDLDFFRPTVKIGVVGRTYHTGRKGENLVAQVMDVPGVEWHFTGNGWPKPGLNLRDDQMSDFYNSMDYILVPSQYEGGPMSVIEALACGCEVIAPPVGWVPDFPHIEYRTGDAQDLRRVLTNVVETRLKLRESVLNRGWENWVQGHDKLFRKLGKDLVGTRSSARIKPGLVKRPAILTHGTEMQTDKGGPSVRAPRTALELSRLGIDAEFRSTLDFDQRERDLYHVYNLWNPKSCRQTIDFAKMGNSPVVLSTIYLDLSERPVFDQAVPAIFKTLKNRKVIALEFARLREKRLAQADAAPAEPYEGYHAEVRSLIQMSDHVICLSEQEMSSLKAIGADMSASTIVRNPVDASLHYNASPDLFFETFGVKDYILCVGRLEGRKNQITLLHALRESGLPVVIVGHAPSPEYEALLRSVAHPDVVFTGRIAANSPLLASAYAGARVFCLPSWSEGAPLVALEASAAGCKMVLSDRSAEREYFGARATYVDPADPEAILEAIVKAYNSPHDLAEREEQKRWTKDQFGWESHARQTAAVYELAATVAEVNRPSSSASKIYVDLTSSANRSGPPSGIARVEERYAFELYDLMPDKVEFVLWNGDRGRFISVTYDQFKRGKHKALCSKAAPAYLFDETDCHPAGLVQFEKGAILLVLGGAWIRNANYVRSLALTKLEKQLSLVPFIHDVIQSKFEYWFPDNVGLEFSDNCKLLIEAADHVLVNSQCTLDDVRDFCIENSLVPPPMDKVRFGDEIDTSTSTSEAPQFDLVMPIIGEQPFVLCVSAIDVRKNHILLSNVWEKLVDQHGDKPPHIIMVGSKGWNIDGFLSSVSKNKKIKSRFHILNGINDATLDWLYRNCLFTVYPSLYEGWGLPVAEALNYGKIVVAADAGSVPEIAPEVTDLIDPLDFPTWYKTISAYAFNDYLRTAREQVVAQYKPVTWKESGEFLYEKLLNLRVARKMPRDLSVGRDIQFSVVDRNQKTSAASVYMAGGWSNPEVDGTWTIGSKARMRFNLQGFPGVPFVFVFEGVGFVPSGMTSQIVNVMLQGEKVGTLSWGGARSENILFLNPSICAALLAADDVSLAFDIRNPTSPAATGRGNDQRTLGIKLYRMEIREVDILPVDTWIEDSRNDNDVSRFNYWIMANGGENPKLPVLCNLEPSEIPKSGIVYLAIRYFVSVSQNQGDIVTLEVCSGEQGVTNLTVRPNRLQTSYIPMSVASVAEGSLISLKAWENQSVTKIVIEEFAVLTTFEPRHFIEVGLGEVLDFSDAVASPPEAVDGIPHALATAGVGWSWPEENGTWSDGKLATLFLRLNDPSPGARLLEIVGSPLRDGPIGVSINGGEQVRFHLLAGDFSGGQGGRTIVPLPAVAENHRVLQVTFHVPTPLVEGEIGGPNDRRGLGFKLNSMVVHKASDLFALAPLPTARHISFGDSVDQTEQDLVNNDLRQGLISGWSVVEPNGVWTVGTSGLLLVRVDGGLLNAKIILAVNTLVSSAIEISINGRKKERWDCVPFERVKCALPLTEEDVQGQVISISLSCDEAASPIDLDGSPDGRVLGLYLWSAQIVDGGDG